MKNSAYWASPNDKIFFPREAAKKLKILPPGIYSICNSPQGIYFNKNKIDLGDLIRFKDENIDKVLHEITTFWSKKELFQKHKFPYKRGVLLYGPPGSGKTSTIKLVIEEVIAMGGIAINFDEVDTFNTGMQLLRNIQPDTPIVVLMEDLDSLLEYNSQSSVLNILDGVSGFDNVVYLATTNYISKLEGRIKNRPSRFDRKFFIDFPNEQSRKLYLEHIIGNSDDFKNINIAQWVKASKDFTPAHLKELFLSVAFFGNDFNEVVKRLRKMKSVADYDVDENDYNNDYNDDDDDDDLVEPVEQDDEILGKKLPKSLMKLAPKISY